MLIFLCRDRNFLKVTAGLLDVEDFKSREGKSAEREWVARVALDWWKKYKDPIAGDLRWMMQEYCREHKTLPRLKDKIFELVNQIRRAAPADLVAPEAVEKIVLEYKHRQRRKQFVEKLIEYQEKGKLTDQKILNEVGELQKQLGVAQKAIDYGITLKRRILRREKEKLRKFPFLLIDPLDDKVRTFPRGSLGLIIAKYARGKSMALAWIARAMALQGYNVLFFTLEDPIETVEDRLDSMMTGLPIMELQERSDELRERFKRIQYLLRGKIRMVDGTEGGMSVQRIEEVWERVRNQGYLADVVIIDYDDEIIPPFRYGKDDGRRREFADIYRALRVFASKKNIYVWTAAQTKRGKENQMIVTGDDIAEDISKVRKVAFCVGIGAGPGPDSIYGGDWGPNGRYLYIAKHKFDRQKIGWPILGDFDAGLFYDSEATLKKLDEYQRLRAKKRKK